MLTLDHLRAIALERPGCVDTVSWGNPSMKVNGKILFYWNKALGEGLCCDRKRGSLMK